MLKKKSCDELGIEYEGHQFEETITQEELEKHVVQMRQNPKISGILVQLPLPQHINESDIANLIGPDKDIDGMHPLNIGSNE